VPFDMQRTVTMRCVPTRHHSHPRVWSPMSTPTTASIAAPITSDPVVWVVPPKWMEPSWQDETNRVEHYASRRERRRTGGRGERRDRPTPTPYATASARCLPELDRSPAQSLESPTVLGEHIVKLHELRVPDGAYLQQAVAAPQNRRPRVVAVRQREYREVPTPEGRRERGHRHLQARRGDSARLYAPTHFGVSKLLQRIVVTALTGPVPTSCVTIKMVSGREGHHGQPAVGVVPARSDRTGP
jgi:hypothetical protein